VIDLKMRGENMKLQRKSSTEKRWKKKPHGQRQQRHVI